MQYNVGTVQRIYNTISTNKYSVHKREEAWRGWTWVFAKITVVVTVDIGGRYAIDYRVQDRTGVRLAVWSSN